MSRLFLRLQPVIIILAAICLNARPAQAASSGSISININFDGAHQRDDQLFASIIMAGTREYFGLVSIGRYQQYSSRGTELITAFYLAVITRQKPIAVLQQRKKGKGWGRLAKELGLPANYWAKNGSHGKKKHGQSEFSDDEVIEQIFYLRYLAGYYNVEEWRLQLWLKQGFSQSDLLIGLNISAQARRPAGGLFALRSQGQTWASIALRYHLSPAAAATPAKPCRRQEHGSWDEAD